MNEWEESIKDVDELMSYVYVDDEDSRTEALKLMCNLVRYPDYMSEDLLRVLRNEIKEELRHYKIFSKIVTTEETYTRKITELAWYSGR